MILKKKNYVNLLQNNIFLHHIKILKCYFKINFLLNSIFDLTFSMKILDSTFDLTFSTKRFSLIFRSQLIRFDLLSTPFGLVLVRNDST